MVNNSENLEINSYNTNNIKNKYNIEDNFIENKNPEYKIIVTSALPYVNNIPHLGNLVCVISADVYTRFLRLLKKNVISVLGTDEHGTTTETKAIEEGLTPKEICDKYYKIHKEIYDWFECDFDCFGRTSSKENAEITKDIFLKIEKNGFIVKDTIIQAFCEKCNRFLADRFIEGICPKCNYEFARGDQCESCGTLLNSNELINPKCKICKNTPIEKESEHLFIDLPKLEPELTNWINKVNKNWSENAKTMTNAWLKEGLKKRCITRDLKWGIPVPLKGYENKVFYSWFDAPIGYIGITAENRKDWKEYWKNPKNTKLVQFMGKDNIPFHTILFPSFLIATRENYTLVNELSVNEFLNYEGGQFSKSRNIGVFGDDAKNTGISADVFRYYLMINRPEKSDSEFLWDDFLKKNNSELVANLGNLVNRTIVFINRNYNSKIPKALITKEDEKILEEIREIEIQIEKELLNINIKEALKLIMHISRIGNQYLQENEPWKNPSEERKATCLNVLANIVKDLSILIHPYLPNTSKKIQNQLNIFVLDWNDLGKLSLKEDHTINQAELLFKKIEDKEIQNLKLRFSKKNQEDAEENKIKSNENKTNEKSETKNSENTFDKIQLRIAQIYKIEKHPSAEKLYIEHIDLGDEKRIIVSGLVPYYKEDELLNKKIVVVTNLESAKIRGVESFGMLLACENNNKVEIITSDANIGDYVFTDEKNIEKIKSLKKITLKEFSECRMYAKNYKIFAEGKELKTLSGKIFLEKISEGTIK